MPAKNTKLSLLKQMLETAESSLAGAHKMLAELIGEPAPAPKTKSAKTTKKAREIVTQPDDPEGKIIEGIFDGQNMIGHDGKTYSVPANYASKSKLVEGDTLKLTIAADGSFIYKQIGPVERKRVIGKLIRDEATDEFVVDAQGHHYKVLRASITYFKADEGDEVVVLMPQNAEATWVAVENIIKAGETVDDLLSDGIA
ncbi:MAG: hypothetical protein V1778_01990 [bacterium]